MTQLATIPGNRADWRELARRAGMHPRDLVGRKFARVADPSVDDVDRMPLPETVEGFEQMLSDNDRMQGLFQQPQAFSRFVSNYARVVLNRDQSIATQVREQTERTLTAWLRENEPEAIQRLDLSAIRPGGGQPLAAQQAGVYNPRAMGAAIDREFPTGSAEYFRAIWHNTQRDAPLQAKISRIRNAFSSTVPSEGGFLIPETLRSELLRVALETSIVRSRARVIPMESLTVPFPAVDATSNVSSVFGGIVCYWTEEGAALTASSAAFSRIVLTAKKLTAYCEVPNELISDSGLSFQAFIDGILPEALSFYEDDAFINGSGVGEPLGFRNGTAMVTVSKETNQGTGTIVWENLVKMFARMLPTSLGRAVWLASIDTFPQLATMSLAVGTGGSAIWLNNGQVGPPMTILGRPVIFTEKTPTVGSLSDINLVDFGFYLVGDRQVMSALSSPHYKFANDQTAYRVVERVDGRPWLNSSITPKNGGSALSPFVNLEAR
ncbi:MAG: phage major capsid protein [Mycobacterium sp.]|nr:phage major capsid protein [Mycobacterium sp.]